jgi:hypothetical protein
MEIYSSIHGYKIEGYNDYIIDTDGNIYSFKLNRLLKQTKSTKGYIKVSLNKNKYKREFCLHRLVAMTFLPNPENKPQVNHIDGNKENNSLSNLEWVTGSENIKHAVKTGLRDKAHEKARIANQKMVLHKSTGIFYDSLKIACESLNLKYGSARNYINNPAKINFDICYV